MSFSSPPTNDRRRYRHDDYRPGVSDPHPPASQSIPIYQRASVVSASSSSAASSAAPPSPALPLCDPISGKPYTRQDRFAFAILQRLGVDGDWYALPPVDQETVTAFLQRHPQSAQASSERGPPARQLQLQQPSPWSVPAPAGPNGPQFHRASSTRGRHRGSASLPGSPMYTASTNSDNLSRYGLLPDSPSSQWSPALLSDKKAATLQAWRQDQLEVKRLRERLAVLEGSAQEGSRYGLEQAHGRGHGRQTSAAYEEHNAGEYEGSDLSDDTVTSPEKQKQQRELSLRHSNNKPQRPDSEAATRRQQQQQQLEASSAACRARLDAAMARWAEHMGEAARAEADAAREEALLMELTCQRAEMGAVKNGDLIEDADADDADGDDDAEHYGERGHEYEVSRHHNHHGDVFIAEDKRVIETTTQQPPPPQPLPSPPNRATGPLLLEPSSPVGPAAIIDTPQSPRNTVPTTMMTTTPTPTTKGDVGKKQKRSRYGYKKNNRKDAEVGTAEAVEAGSVGGGGAGAT